MSVFSLLSNQSNSQAEMRLLPTNPGRRRTLKGVLSTAEEQTIIDALGVPLGGKQEGFYSSWKGLEYCDNNMNRHKRKAFTTFRLKFD